MEGSELDLATSPAIKALGSFFTLTQVYLLDDCYAATKEILHGSLHDEETTDDMELSRQLSALGLPISFRTSKRNNGIVKGKIKNRKPQHSLGDEGNESVIDVTQLSDEKSVSADIEKVGTISGEVEFSEYLTSSITCASMEELQGFSRVASKYSLNSDTAIYSESSEILDHDEADSKAIGDSEVWASYWDSFYCRYYFYNTRTNETTWDPPPGMEHLAFGEVIDKPEEMIGDIVETLGSRCSIDSFGEYTKDDQSVDQISGEPCLSFELAVENLHSSMSISTLNYRPESLNEVQEYMDSGEIEKLEDKAIDNILQSQMNSALHEEEPEDDSMVRKHKKKARKRTRLNRKLSIISGDIQFQGILEEGIPPKQGVPEELSPSITKYWCQRYLLFSRYDHGIKMDEQGWFSATPESIAKHHAFRCGDGVIVDCFTGVGGNAIQFARRGKHVIAIDIDPKKIEYAQHNAAIYGVSDHIDFISGDSFFLGPRLKADTVFLSPPWGGPNYLKASTYDINTLGGNVLFKFARGIASKVVMFLPRTVDLNQLAEMSLSVDPPWSLEVERNFLNGKLKAITAYFTKVEQTTLYEGI